MSPIGCNLPKMFLRSIFLLGLGLGLSLACSGDSDDGAPRIPADIVLVPNQPSIPQGLSLKLTAKVVDAQGHQISGQTVSFSSSDVNTLTVDPDGTMHSVGPLGSARVTADLNGLTNFVDVTVTQRIVEFTTEPESLVINPTLTAFLQPVFKDFAGNITPFPGPVTFSSNNTNLVQVNQGGAVQAQNTLGRTTITIQADTFEINVPVRVAQIPSEIITEPINVVMQSGQSRQLSVTVRDLANAVITTPALTFTSGSPGLFSVSSTGLVTSLGGNGNGVLHVTLDTLTKDLGVYIGSPTPIALVHSTQTGTSMYEADIGGSGQLVVSEPDAQKGWRGVLPGFTESSIFNTVGAALGVAVNHAGTRAYVASGDQITVYDLSNGSLLTPIAVSGGGTKVAIIISPDDQKAYIGSNLMTYTADLATGVLVDSISAGIAFFLAVDPAGQKLYASESTLREIDLATRAVTREYGGTSGPKDVAVSSNGSEVLVADEGLGKVLIFNRGSGALISTLSPRGGGFGLAVSAHLIVASAGEWVTLYDATSKAMIAEIQVHGTARRPAISPDEKTIVIPSEGGWLDFIQ